MIVKRTSEKKPDPTSDAGLSQGNMYGLHPVTQSFHVGLNR